ncbi:MAG: glutamate racemase [Cryomorphaceae bacterium]|nr:glutamate racemase [Cryomorphaceae bacterium]
MSNNHPQGPIGIFDSGVGGLTIARAVRALMPYEDILYFGDTLHLPYGEKSPDAIRRYSDAIARFLLKNEAKCILIACNSASANAFHHLKNNFPEVLFINVIDPVVDYVRQKDYASVGVIGTKATISSNAYQKRLNGVSKQVIAKATPLLAAMIEEGFTDGDVAESVITAYLGNDHVSHSDALILGCTHYPLISEKIQNIVDDHCEIIDGPGIIATFTKDQLEARKLMAARQKPGTIRMYVSDHTPSFARLASLFFGDNLDLKEQNLAYDPLG